MNRPVFKIAMVAASPFPYPQGSQVLISQLAEALQRRGHKVQVVSYPRGVGPLPTGVEIHRVQALPGLGLVKARPSWRKPPLDLLLAQALLGLVRRWQPDVLHTHNFEGLLAALYVRLRTGTPVVYHVHNAMGLELHTYFRSRWGQWVGRLAGQWIDANLPQRADYCIVLTEAAVGYFQQRGTERLRVIPPGIDFEPGNAARGRQTLGDGPLVLYSGNLDRYQDLDLLLQAFQIVMNARPDARLVFSTNAPPDAWQGQVAAMGLIENAIWAQATDFRGVRNLLAATDVAVCPRTVCLGFPIKLLNYMAAGKAIVVSEGSACGLRHLENGWIVADGDAAGMAEAIVKLLQDRGLAHRLGASARQTAETEFTWEQAAVAIEKIYAEIGRLC